MDIKYFSENNIIELCKFINFPTIGIQVRSSKNIIQDNKFLNANPVNPQCNDPVSIYLHCDHITRGDYNIQQLIYPCFSNKVIDNIFRNAGQAIQTAYHRGESYNPVENSTPNYYNNLNYELASVSNTLICGNISFKTPDKYGKYEDDFTFKIGSQCNLKPVYIFENYCWGNRTWNQSCGSNKSDGNIGDAIVIWGWASNLLIYNNYIDNCINGISGISLKTDKFFSNAKQYYWNIHDNCFSNIITGSGFQYSASDYRSAGFLWPGRYTIGTSLYLQNNTFINVEDPTVIEDISSDCPPPNLQLEPNFNPNFWGGIQTNLNFLSRINNNCPVWPNYTPIQYDEYLNKNFNPPSKSFFNFRTKFINDPNINCCN